MTDCIHKLTIVAVLVAIVAGLLKLACRHYCVYIPGIIFVWRNPRAEYRPISWAQGSSQESSLEDAAYHKHDPKRPNVVLILSDDLGFNDITFFGGGIEGGIVQTPNIDSIGQAGVSFNMAYAGHATCAPSRASLMTGKFASKVGLEFTPVAPAYAKALAKSDKAYRKGIYHADREKDVNASVMVLPTTETTVAEVFKTIGYRTLMLGKWHLGATNETQPNRRGFDEVVGFHGGILSRYLDFGDEEAVNFPLSDGMDQFLVANLPYSVTKDGGQRFAPKGYLTDYLADEACNAIRANKERPFFLYLPFTAPHTPFQALKSDVDSLPKHITDPLTQTYAGMVVALDRAVGKVLNALKETGLDENTLVIFANDNGAPSYAQRAQINKPYRGFKGTFFEGGLRVPLFMRWPEVIPAGLAIDDMVSLIDIFPTVIAATTANAVNGGEKDQRPIEDRLSLDGVNLLPFINKQIENNAKKEKEQDADEEEEEGSKAENAEKEAEVDRRHVPHEFLFWRSGHYMAIRTERFKLQVSGNPDRIWFHDLLADPTEKRDLSAHPNYKQERQELMARLKAENAKSRAPLWPSLTETAICIDALYETPDENDDDEYVYWPN